MMKHLFLILSQIKVCMLGILLFIMGCSEDLTNPIPIDGRGLSKDLTSVNPLSDSNARLVALTPLNGPNATVLKKIKILQIEHIRNFNQSLPNDTDVLYINTSEDCSKISESTIFNEALERLHTRILIDGTPKSIEKFCKENFPIFEPGSEMIAYFTDSGTEPGYDNLFGIYSFGANKNEISVDGLLGPLFNTSVPISISNDTTYLSERQENKMRSSASQNSMPFCNGSINWTNYEQPWQYDDYLRSNDSWGREHGNIIAPDGSGVHIHNPSSDMWNWGFTQRTKKLCGGPKVTNYQCGWNYYDVRRINCGDQNGTSGWVKKYWTQQKIGVVKKPNNLFKKTDLIRFNTKIIKSGYLDFQLAQDSTVTKGKSWSLGASLSANAKLSVVTIEAEMEYKYTKSKNQTRTLGKSIGREFWVSPCISKATSNGIIYGQLKAFVGVLSPNSYIVGDVSVPYSSEMNDKSRSIVYRMADPNRNSFLIDMTKKESLFYGPMYIGTFWYRQALADKYLSEARISWKSLRNCLWEKAKK
ncbi:MAG: hypothetical protein ACK4R6_02295 [Spirosomataceae bacterium]